MHEPLTSSLGTLSDSEWNQLSARWGRGIDWIVHKVGRKWEIGGRLGQGFPLFTTKTAAYEMATNLILRESHHRAWLKMPYHCRGCDFHTNYMPDAYQHALSSDHLVWQDVDLGYSFSPMDPDIYTPETEETNGF